LAIETSSETRSPPAAVTAKWAADGDTGADVLI
jgi:hypothetical protein